MKAEADKISLTEDEVKACVDDPEGCPASGEYQEAYATLLLPFLLNRVPYNGLGIGQVNKTIYSSPSNVASCLFST